ncbi:thioredoxin family protein [Hallella bergensis]|uniref:thioredoxin family protein n=1 Tax=Hallella bergensis TaxID=242750 RepID=UPI0039904328
MKKTILCMLFMLSCVCGFAQSAFYADDINAGSTLSYNGAVVEVDSKQTFDVYMGSTDKVVVFFYTEWCGPCRMMSVFCEELASRYPEILFLMVDAEKLEDIAQEYRIRTVPTVLGFYKHNSSWQIVGGCSKSKLENHVQLLL